MLLSQFNEVLTHYWECCIEIVLHVAYLCLYIAYLFLIVLMHLLHFLLPPSLLLSLAFPPLNLTRLLDILSPPSLLLRLRLSPLDLHPKPLYLKPHPLHHPCHDLLALGHLLLPLGSSGPPLGLRPLRLPSQLPQRKPHENPLIAHLPLIALRMVLAILSELSLSACVCSRLEDLRSQGFELGVWIKWFGFLEGKFLL